MQTHLSQAGARWLTAISGLEKGFWEIFKKKFFRFF